MKNRLFVNALKSVGLVAAGDDPESTVTFWKSKDADEMLPNVPPVGKVSPKAESLKDKPGARMDLSAIESEDLRSEIQKALDAKDAENETLQSQVDDLTAKVEKLDPPDPVEKADPELQELIKAQQEKTEELEKKLAEERSTRRTAEYISKAQPLAPLMGKPEDVGPVLADLADKAPESFEKLEGWLTAAVQRSDLAKLFSQIGHEGEGESDPIAKRDAYVTKYLEDNPDKSPEEARAAFWKANPEAKEELRS